MGPENKGTSIPGIQWEDDDADFGKTEDVETSDPEFAAMMGKDEDDEVRLLVGEKVRGKVARVPTTGDVMVDLSGKSSGIIERAELLADGGEIELKVGDPIEVFVVSKRGGEILLSYKMSAALKSAEDLERAKRDKIGVKGRVTKAVKGGFEVTMLGKTAFCPVSQIDTRFVDNQTEYVGKEFDFIVEKVEGNGRNIVVSRSALLRKQAESKTAELLANLQPDQVFTGTVTQVRDFGAFVDIGGVEGMVHVSALSHARVARPSDVVTIGDKVQVKVLKIERDDRGRPKISLSMKAASQDPWDRIHDLVQGGKTYTGRVTNLMQFGAFIEIQPGIEGLLHVSEMSWTKRVHHPSDVVKVGDMVTVIVKDVDTQKKRISLTMKQVEDDPWFGVANKFPTGTQAVATVERLKPFGAIVALADGLTGLVPMNTIKRRFGEAYRQPCTPGKTLEVVILNVDAEQRKILLSLVGVDAEDDDRKHYQEYLEAEKAQKELDSLPAAKSGSDTGSFGELLKRKLEKR